MKFRLIQRLVRKIISDSRLQQLHRLSTRLKHPGWFLSLILLTLALIVRGLPYLAPIRAADLVQKQAAIEFVDRNGLPLGTILTRDQEHTVAVSLPQVSSYFIQAILAAEDQRFYQHGPLDLQAIGRALVQAAQTGRIVSGASTITMQLSRMIHPVPGNLGGKLQEIWTAWRLGAGMSKDEILQAYLNRLPMGGNIYGIEAGARTYFGIPAQELTLAQSSLLAALPNDPTDLSPYNSWERLKQRQKYVLDRLVKQKQITPEQAERTFTEIVILQPPEQGIIAAPHFLFWLSSQLPADAPSRLQTTIDRPLQQFVETQVQQVAKTLAVHNAHHAAAIVIDNQSGEVLAYVGSPNYFATAQLGQNDGVQALRQPGSALKPFLYELALERRLIRPNTVLADIPTHYAIPGARLYSPVDYHETYQGPVRVRLALANSLNIPAVRVLEKVGVAHFLQRLQTLGFQHLNHSAEYYGLGLTLGSGEVSLWELAQAYLTLANQGRPRSLVVHRSLPRSPAPSLSAATPWALVTDILSDRQARAKAFGVDSILNLPFVAAVKTGTSSDFRDTWTIGFSRNYTVATWVGNFNGEPMRQISGVTGAAPLWNRIMLHLHEGQEPAAFDAPPELVQRPICALSGLRPTATCPTVVQEYFYPQDLGEYEQQWDSFYQPVLNSSPGSPPYRLNLPPEYNEWLNQQRTEIESGSLRILSPQAGDYFLLYPASTEEQRLEFKILGDLTQPVEWRLNGRKLSAPPGQSLFWPLQPGRWTLQVSQGQESAQVSFEVQAAEGRSDRRGFSRVSQTPP